MMNYIIPIISNFYINKEYILLKYMYLSSTLNYNYIDVITIKNLYKIDDICAIPFVPLYLSLYPFLLLFPFLLPLIYIQMELDFGKRFHEHYQEF